MKKLLVVTSMCLMAFASAQAAQIGVVNMERLIQAHPRTAQDRAILERYIADFDVERDERLAALRALSESFETLRAQAEDIGLTPEAAQERRQRAQLKFEELRQAEVALRDVATRRQQELTNQEIRMRDRIVRDIKRVVREVADEKGLDLVLDGGEDPAGGYGAVIFARPPFELTEEVILKLRAVPETPAQP